MNGLVRVCALAALMFGMAAGQAMAATVVLRASHQFPGGKGDVRDEMVQIIAKEAKAANVDLEIQVYPGASLFKPNEQWNAMVNGQLDMTSLPLDYASGKVRAFGATLMPGLVRSHDRAQRMNDSKFMKEIRDKIEQAGVIVLSDAWLAGAIASKRQCIRTPADIKGQKLRSAGPTFAAMWQAAGGRLFRFQATKSITRCRRASRMRPTPAPGASYRFVCTNRSSALLHRGTMPYGSCTSRY